MKVPHSITVARMSQTRRSPESVAAETLIASLSYVTGRLIGHRHIKPTLAPNTKE